MRKISLLIEKARIEKNHEVLEMGCGWGTFAIEVVKRTGCKYTGITLSIEQLKYAKAKVKEAGLQGRITFMLCDYRQLSDARKYDRIIACEMIEAVGHEFMDKFFSCCEDALAENGIFVLQVTLASSSRFPHHYIAKSLIVLMVNCTTVHSDTRGSLRREQTNFRFHNGIHIPWWMSSFFSQSYFSHGLFL
jgi:cyclopropane-fatty-acyl-phospholipid synthase